MMKRVFRWSSVVGVVILSIPLLAQALNHVLEVQRYEGIPYVTGGIGLEERQALKAMARDFNLKLTFAAKEGKYLNDVQVSIQDRRGNVVLEAVSKGPWLYASLPPGTYTVIASGFGESFQRVVQVPSAGQAQVNFYWPWPEEDIIR